MLSTGAGQSSDIRECCVVFALYGFLKAYCLAQTRGSKLWTYWIFQLFAFNQKSLTLSYPISQLVPFLRHLCSTSLMLLLLDFCPSRRVRPGLQSLLHRDFWELAPGGGSSREAHVLSLPWIPLSEATSSSRDLPRPRGGTQIQDMSWLLNHSQWHVKHFSEK